MAGLFIGLFVDKCTACQNHWKSDFGWHRFQKWAYSLALAWGIRGLKSVKRFWNSWWPSEAASRLVSLSHYCFRCVFFSVFRKSSVWFMRLTLKHEQWSSIRFKKPLDIFWPANSKKRFRRLFSYYFGCKQRALSDFLASSSSWKRANTGKQA